MKQTAVYAGSFDPLTYGHIDIIRRAANIFPEVIVAVVANPRKNTLFSIQERVKMIKYIVRDIDFLKEKNIKVESFGGLLVDFLKMKESDVVIRGLRALSDFEYEFQMALTNSKLFSSIDTIFLMPSQEYTYFSSSMVKEIASLKGDVTPFVPQIIAENLAKKYKK